MISLLLGLFNNSFTELLGKPSFWFILVGVIGLIVVAVFCIKYPKLGGPVLLSLFGIILVILDVYCIMQINTYYTAEGGIHGKLTGIFNTNEIEVVDNLKFEVKNIELKEKSDGVYSAIITTDQVLSLDTKQSLGIFVNGMPCDTVSEVQSDYAIANYSYTFYDIDNTAICTDTLILNLAFYEKSTYLSLTTKGGTLPVEQCVDYWHHYFNKNGFEVEIAPFNKASGDVSFENGDISNYAVINYYVEGELYSSDCVPKGETVTLIKLDSTEFLGWYTLNDKLVYESIVLNENINLYAKMADETTTKYNITFDVSGKQTTCVYYEGQELTEPEVSVPANYEFVGWTNSKSSTSTQNLTSYVPTVDTTFYALFRRRYDINCVIDFTADEILNGVVFDLDDYADIDGTINNFAGCLITMELTKYADRNVTETTNLRVRSTNFNSSGNFGTNLLKVNLNNNNEISLNEDKSFTPNGTNYSFKIVSLIILKF